MPIYEYECNKCGIVEEVFQKISDKPLSKCRKCSGKVSKLISHSSFHLKGTGWYVTDYAGKAGAAAAASSTNVEKSASADAATSSDSGSSSKPKDKKTTTATEKAS